MQVLERTYSERLADCSDHSDEGIVTKMGNSLEDTQQTL
jgi:hypothetical protein